ncbi:cytidylyltransferase domain-containing protein [Methanospirillum lacunae]|uniref:Acylneuraminate cytidylyltransferase n=1 Tax=Methanospirillum lacunae TaxID=668570 RepID=A0A2V2N2T5_9EURY|nr:glycosyltransferase family protein [Methanospirillum lacunae]PWR72855.1 acylneuraminate cytidylyltransferase [Methanospirillum lacunae]
MSKPCIGVIVQARMGSTRLPGKVLMDLTNGCGILGYILKRLSECCMVDKIIVATSENSKDDTLSQYLENNNYLYFRGSESDCLDRYYNAAKNFSLDIVVRITADCPLIVPGVIDEMVRYYIDNLHFIDYLSNRQYTNFPEGLDTEIFNSQILEEAAKNATSIDEREHINYFFLRRDDKYRIRYFNHNMGHDYSRFKLSIDTKEDYLRISKLFNCGGLPFNFNFIDLINILTNFEHESEKKCYVA